MEYGDSISQLKSGKEKFPSSSMLTTFHFYDPASASVIFYEKENFSAENHATLLTLFNGYPSFLGGGLGRSNTIKGTLADLLILCLKFIYIMASASHTFQH